MTAPHYELIIQCIDVVKGLPIDCWESQTWPVKRAAGLVARWAIEKAFECAILARGAEIPKNRMLVNLLKASGVSLIDEQRELLQIVDRDVTATELDDSEGMGLYLDCCYLARGIVQTVHQHMALIEIMTRKT